MAVLVSIQGSASASECTEKPHEALPDRGKLRRIDLVDLIDDHTSTLVRPASLGKFCVERIEDSAPGLLGVIGLDRAIDIKADGAVPPVKDAEKALTAKEASEVSHGPLWSHSRAGDAAPDQHHRQDR